MKWKLLIVVGAAIALAIVGINLAEKNRPSEIGVAIQSARATLPEFRKRLSDPNPEDRAFFIRARFTGGKVPEFLWMRNVQPAEGGFKGKVDEEPKSGASIEKGQEVSVPEKDVVDWTILLENGKTEGAFTRGTEPR